jgi:signal transduction histidine kinase
VHIHRLSWRIGIPFLLFVLAETVALVAYMNHRIASEEQARLESTAADIANFIEVRRLSAGLSLARDLGRVTKCDVFFRGDHGLEPPAWDETARRILGEQPADGAMRRHASFAAVATTIPNLEIGAVGKPYDLVIVRRFGPDLGHRGIVEALTAFFLLAVLTAWLVGRGVVRPLRNLAAQIPSIERPGELRLPESERGDEIGEVARSFLRTRDALQREKSDRAQAEKFAVLGRMTAALAHEVQNPVAAIRMHAQLWQGDGGDGAARVEVAQIIEQQAERIEGLLNQWMFLTRPEPPALGPVDLGALVAQVARSLQHQAEHARVRIAVEVPTPLVVQADAKRLAQVFSNLLANAIQAMPHGGVARVTGQEAGDRVEVLVADQGTGFSAAALERYAEFFYSEKEGGMGIGLTVATEIVHAHGGTLRVANRPGGGAAITVALPKRPAPVPPPAPRSPREEAP